MLVGGLVLVVVLIKRGLVLVMCLGIGVTGWSLGRKRIVDVVRSLRGEALGILVVVRFSLGSVFWIVKGRRVRSGRRRGFMRIKERFLMRD